MTVAAPSIITPANWISTLTDNNVLRWQHGETNIGLLLAPLLSVNGWQGDVLALRDALPASAREVAINDVLTVMAALSYRIHQEKRDATSLRAEDMPGLFIPDKPQGWCAAMVLREVGAYGLIWEDGRTQHRGDLPAGMGTLYRFERVLADDVAAQDLAIKPAADWLKDFFARFRPLLLHAMFLSLIMHVFMLAMPLFSLAIYDRVVGAHAPETLPLLAAGVLGAITVEAMIRTVRIRLAGWVGSRAGVLVMTAMFERLLYLPANMIEQASVSMQLARIKTFEAVRDFIASPAFLAMLEAPFVLVLILVIAFLAGPVALTAVGAITAYGLLLFLLRPRWQRLGQESAHTAAQHQQLMMEILGHLKSFYAGGLNAKMLQRFKSISWQATRAQYKFAMISSIVQHIAAFMGVVAGVSAIGWSLSRVWSGDMTGGAMVATMILMWRVIYLLQSMTSLLPQLEQVRGSAEQVNQLMRLIPESHAKPAVQAQHTLKGRVSLQNVAMRYGRADPIFAGLSAEIEKGQIIAVYGNNGSGKSTVLRMLLGLYSPAMGQVRLDGTDYRQFDPRGLRRQITYLPQVPELLPGTIAENLRLNDPLAPDFKLRQALLWADAWETVEKLPAGANTRLGADGFTPSSGLAARLCLARLYLSERPIVLCDELPSQILNSSTGERFKKFLEECRGKRTVIFVTHREDWLKLADQVLWLKPDGRPVMGKPKVEAVKVEPKRSVP